MAIKRVSDLSCISVDSTILSRIDAGNTEFTKSRMEISWNTNPSNGSSSSGDDNEFESRAITVEGLSSGITYPILNKDITFVGCKTFNDKSEFKNGLKVLSNGIDATGNYVIQTDQTHISANENDIDITYNTNLNIWHGNRLILRFSGDNVSAYGNWYFEKPMVKITLMQ